MITFRLFLKIVSFFHHFLTLHHYLNTSLVKSNILLFLKIFIKFSKGYSFMILKSYLKRKFINFLDFISPILKISLKKNIRFFKIVNLFIDFFQYILIAWLLEKKFYVAISFKWVKLFICLWTKLIRLNKNLFEDFSFGNSIGIFAGF